MRSAKHVSINELKKQPRLGMSLADEMKKFADGMDDLNKGGTANKIAKQIDAFAGSLKGVGATITEVNNLVSANINEFAAMSAGVGRATAYFDDYAKATLKSIKNQSFLIESQQDLQKEFKLSSAGAFDFSKRLRAINVEIGDAKLFKYAAGLGKITGGFINSEKANKAMVEQLVKTQAFLQNNIGLSEEGAQSFELYAAGMGQSSEEALVKINEMSTALSEFTGIDAVQQQSQIIQDIASMGADLQLQYGGVGNKLEVATMKARLLGTSMESLHGTGQSLLNIESSIGAEMEYQQLTGRRLLDNQGKSLTNEYRMATVTGNATKQAELMNQFIASEGDTLEHNLFARKKAAELMGTDEATLAKMIQKRKLLVDLGAEEVMNMTADKATAEIADMRAKAVAAGNKKEVKKIDDLIKESDTRTPAERSADSLDAIKKDIAFIGQGGTIAGDGKRDGGATMGKDFLTGLQTSIDESMDFAKAASKTFTDTNFIKGIGTLGIVGDRLVESITPIKHMAETLPGILGTGLTKLTTSIDSIIGKIKQPPGGEEKTLATGGYISGAGSGTSDSIPARLSDGEYVINASATRRNKSLLDKINSGGPVGYAAGGAVTSNARMEGLLQSILVTLRGSNVMGDTSMNGRKRI
jgi:hypothetical protein|tara:strand:- start:337 stop:2262 length:1926 start_codon:yes stop_codon:yes gene_type:complete